MKRYLYPMLFVVTGISVFYLGIVIFRTGKYVSYHYHVIADFEGTEIIFGPVIMLLGGVMLIYGSYAIYLLLRNKI